MTPTETDEENIHRVTGFAPDKPTDDLEAIINFGDASRGLSVSGIPATVIGCVAPPDLHASNEDWHAWLDGFLRP